MPLDPEVAKHVETTGGVVGTLAAALLAFLTGVGTWLNRKANLAKKAMKEVQDVKADIKILDVRTRRLRKGVAALTQQVKWSSEASEAERIDIRATLAAQNQKLDTIHTLVVEAKTELKVRAEIRKERVMKTRGSDPITPEPRRLEDE